MTAYPTYSHVFELILQLRQAAIENGEAALRRDDGGFGLCLGAALANDAADAVAGLVAERVAALLALATAETAGDGTLSRRHARR